MSTDDYAGGSVIAATVFGLLLPICAMIIRVWVKSRTEASSSLRPEEVFAQAALVFKIALDICGGILLRNGLGSHISSVEPAQLVTFAKTQYSGNYLYTACIACVKISILSQYDRILGPTAHSYFRWQVRALMAMVIFWCLCIFVLSITLCIPLDKFWNPTLPGGCLDITSFYYGMQIPNILTDLFIILCPIYEVHHRYSSQVHSTERARSSMRAAILTMFALGFLTFVFDIVRLVVFVQLESGSGDITYDLVQPAVWTTIEPAIAIVAICLPSCRKAYLMNRQHRNRVEGTVELEETTESSASQTMRKASVPSHQDEGPSEQQTC